MGIRDRPISPRSPWQNPYAERLIGTLRRECLDHVLIVGERHLRRMLASYSSYYNESRTHLALEKDAPLASYPEVRSDHHHANSFRTAPSLCADMIFGRDTDPCQYPCMAHGPVGCQTGGDVATGDSEKCAIGCG